MTYYAHRTKIGTQHKGYLATQPRCFYKYTQKRLNEGEGYCWGSLARRLLDGRLLPLRQASPRLLHHGRRHGGLHAFQGATHALSRGGVNDFHVRIEQACLQDLAQHADDRRYLSSARFEPHKCNPSRSRRKADNLKTRLLFEFEYW